MSHAPDAVQVAPEPIGLSRRTTWIVLTVISAIYVWLNVAVWSDAYVDFGDGNYMYISWCMRQGATLYGDVLAPQPPVHFAVGQYLFRIGEWAGWPPLGFRIWTLLTRLASALLVYHITTRIVEQASDVAPAAIARMRFCGVVAAALFLVLPIGFIWALGYQPHHTQVMLTLAILAGLIKATPRGTAIAGIAAGLVLLTSMTSVPYVAIFALYLLVRRPRQLPYFVLPAAAIWGVVAAYYQSTTGVFFENIVGNQVGAYPDDFLAYAIGKLLQEGRDVLSVDGLFILLALAGMFAYAARETGNRRELVLLTSLAGLGSIVFVTKGGTADYIFVLGEPYVAIFAGYFLGTCVLNRFRWPSGAGVLRDTTPLFALLVASLVALLLLFNTAERYLAVVRHSPTMFELPAAQTESLVRIIRARSREGELVLAPAHFAFMAGRRIPKDFSELLLWRLKYFNERRTQTEGRAVRTVRDIASLIEQGKVAFVILDTAQMNQSSLPEMYDAVQKHFTPLQAPVPALSTSFQMYTRRP